MSDGTNAQISILIATCNAELQRELELLLAALPVEVVATAADGRACLDRTIALRPNVVLLDERIGLVPAFDVARQLALAAPGCATLLVAERHDAHVLHQALTAGARDVLAKPLMLDAVRGSVVRAYELEQARTRQVQHQQSESVLTACSKVIAVYSPRGGAGVSTVAANLAAIFAATVPQTRTVLVDFNMQFGTAASLLGLKPERTLLDLQPFTSDLGSSSAVLSNVLTPHSSGMRLLAAPTMSLDATMSGDGATNILLGLRRMFGFVVVDLPSRMDDATLAVLERADHVLLVMTPDVLSVQATRMALTVCDQRSMPVALIGLVLNRTNKRVEIQPRDIRALFPHPILAEIPADFYNIEGPLSIGRTLAEHNTACPAYEALRKLAKTLSAAQPQPHMQAMGKLQAATAH